MDHVSGVSACICIGSLTKTSRSEMSTVHTLSFNSGFSVEHACNGCILSQHPSKHTLTKELLGLIAALPKTPRVPRRGSWSTAFKCVYRCTNASERPRFNPLSGVECVHQIHEAMLCSDNVSGIYLLFPLWKTWVTFGKTQYCFLCMVKKLLSRSGS